jgi:pheromone shutdown protein TraB
MMSSSPESRAVLRVMMIEMLGKADLLMTAKMPGDMSKMMGVIVEDRNAVVLDDLKRVIASEPGVKSVAIIYGAGHLPTMQKALVKDLGYTPVGDTWRTAMTVDTKEAGITTQQLKAIRDMINRSLDSQLGATRRRVPSAPRAD